MFPPRSFKDSYRPGSGETTVLIKKPVLVRSSVNRKDATTAAAGRIPSCRGMPYCPGEGLVCDGFLPSKRPLMEMVLFVSVLFISYWPGSGPTRGFLCGIRASEPNWNAAELSFGSKDVYWPGPGMLPGPSLFQSLFRNWVPPPKRTVADRTVTSAFDGMPYLPGPGAASLIFCGVRLPIENEGADLQVDSEVILSAGVNPGMAPAARAHVRTSPFGS
mmetsp:Transcript_47432/g.122100  ORF Transcript_47432/g.122100 Transcript_47432/m.122100 type:complete len:218 (-) Transcript_47432:63-716(-)